MKKTAPMEAKPSVIWLILAKEFVSDRRTGSASAINIIEDIYLPESTFGDSKELNVITLDHPISLGFTVDWRWPQEVESDAPVTFKVNWRSPSGKGYAADAEHQVLNRPTDRNRMHVQVAFSNLPIEAEGIYHFEVLLNDGTAARYPVRVRKAKEPKPRKTARRVQKKLATKEAVV